MEPLVTVICLCYNHERFVVEAIQSVLNQSYKNVELIVIDDASVDNSSHVISKVVKDHPHIKYYPFSQNVGNCKAFNYGLSLSKGDYVIDLAADDILLPDRILKGLEAFRQHGRKYGVNFSDADWIDENGKYLYTHSQRFPHQTIPQGDIYRDLIEKFFICSPTMMYSRKMLDELHGYDELLQYEDFDLWIRSSRNYFYCYTPEVLVKKRVVKGSLSDRQFSFFSKQMESTYIICKKILALNRNVAEQKALSKRILYELKLCIRFLRFDLALRFGRLFFKNQSLRY